MDVEVVVLEIEREAYAFAGDGGGEGGIGVEVESVAEFVTARCAAGLNAGGPVARVVAAEAGFAEGAEEIAQRFEAEEVEALVGDLEADGVLDVADFAAGLGGASGVGAFGLGEVVGLH